MSEVQVVEEHPDVVVPLGREEAERLDKRIRLMAGQFVADWVKFQGLVDDARRGQVHLTLGYPSWTAYVAEVGRDLLALPTANAEVRHEVLEWLSSTGMSLRAIAQVAGLSKSTVGRELSGVPNGTADATSDVVEALADGDAALADELTDALKDAGPATVTGMDGKTYTKPKCKPAPTPEAEPEPEPEPVSTRKVQIPTFYRESIKTLSTIACSMRDLVDDPRWSKARDRFTDKDRAELDGNIAVLQTLRAAMDSATPEGMTA